MSGGHFEYNQYRIDNIIDLLEHNIENESVNFDPNNYGYAKETLDEFKKGLYYLKLARIYTHRIDWLLSCDDGEDTFHKRLQTELNELEQWKITNLKD